MILFFAVFFSVYGLVNYYIFIRGWEAIPPGSPLRIWYLVLFLFLALAFIAGRFLERVWYSFVSETLVWVGSFWLAAMLYFFLAVCALDLIRVVNHFFPFLGALFTADYALLKLRTAWTVLAVVALVIFAGRLNALSVRVRTIELSIAKKPLGVDSLSVVSASDIHLGSIIGRSRLRKIVDQVNALKPDLILLPGDIVDEDLGPVIRENLGEMLRSLKARLGVYAVTGNHEYIGGAEEAVAYLRDHGITVLRDSVAKIDSGLYVIGREDRSSTQFGGKKRKALAEIMSQVDRSCVLLLMDHQPFHLEEGEKEGIDVQLSGHTHHGQLWPLNYITEAVYELSWGYVRKGSTHVVVSSGVGTWGPPVRTGNRPEIVLLKLRFQDAH